MNRILIESQHFVRDITVIKLVPNRDGINISGREILRQIIVLHAACKEIELFIISTEHSSCRQLRPTCHKTSTGKRARPNVNINNREFHSPWRVGGQDSLLLDPGVFSQKVPRQPRG
jgi:hypothetical protein